MANISLRCDCAGGLAPEPKIHDIGILASTDPVAIDRACLDLIKKHWDNGTEEWLNQVSDLQGENTIFVAEKHGIGSQEYNFIDIDKEGGNNKTLLIVIICVIAFIIIFGSIIGFIIYKRKKKMGNESYKTVSLIDKKNE